jgi:hypothetical protein
MVSTSTAVSPNPSCRLPLPRFPRGGRTVETFRRDLESAYVAASGTADIGIAAASRIHTACIALRRWLQVERRLRAAKDDMPLSDWLGLADRSIRFKAEVDRALSALGLDPRVAVRSPQDILAEEQLALMMEPDPAAPVAGPPAATDADNRLESHPSDSDAAETRLGALAADDG